MKGVWIYMLVGYFLWSSCTLTKSVNYFNLYKTETSFTPTTYINVGKDSFLLLCSTNEKKAIPFPKNLPQWISYKVDTLPNKLIQVYIKIDSNTENLPRKGFFTIGTYPIEILQKANTLLAQFINYNEDALTIDLTLQHDTQQVVWKNLPLNKDGKIFYPNHIDTTLRQYVLVAALFKNKNNIAIDWWNYEKGISLNKTINIKDSIFMFAGGDGSPRLPYLVANPLQLNAIRIKGCNPNSIVFFKQIENIDLSEAIGMNIILNNDGKVMLVYQNINAIFNRHENGWLPIGDDQQPFTGNYQGNNKIIDGLYIKNITGSQIGLFGKVDPSASISHLHIGKKSFLYNQYNYEDTSISYTNMGSIAGENNGHIIQCSSEATLYSDDENNTGGIVGFNYGTIAGCRAINVYINSYVGGGIVGFNYGHIANCFAKNNIIKGGIIGSITGYNSNSISASHSNQNRLYVGLNGGGLVGYNSNLIIASYTIGDSLSIDDSNEEINIGQLAGFNNLSGNIISCYSSLQNQSWIGSNQNEQTILDTRININKLSNSLISSSYKKFQFLKPDGSIYKEKMIWRSHLSESYPILWWE